MTDFTTQSNKPDSNGTVRIFRERAKKAWEIFESREEELRGLMERAMEETVSRELIARCSDILSAAFEAPSFDVGYDGKYNLIFTLEGNPVRLFQLVYFAGLAPEQLRGRWNILVGRTSSSSYVMRMHGIEISAADFRVWVEKRGDRAAALNIYCEKLLPLLKENEGGAYSFAYILVDQVLGEIASMRYVVSINLLAEPGEGDGILLTELSGFIERELDPDGWDAANDAEAMCGLYTAYRGEPADGEGWPLRADVFVGMSCCMPLVNTYFNGDDYYSNLLMRDGVVPGFFYWSLEGIGKDKVLPLRDKIEEAVSKIAGADAVLFLGGATGEVYGYLDFLAWDFPAVMEAAKKVFGDMPVKFAGFHSFRMNDSAVVIKG